MKVEIWPSSNRNKTGDKKSDETKISIGSAILGSTIFDLNKRQEYWEFLLDLCFIRLSGVSLSDFLSLLSVTIEHLQLFSFHFSAIVESNG